MIGIGGSDWKHYVRRKPNVAKRRIRKGIPDCLRGTCLAVDLRKS